MKTKTTGRTRREGRGSEFTIGSGSRRILSEAVAAARTIIYVHGIGNKPRASILKCQWDRALFGFDLGERSRLAYWVNRDYYPDPIDATCGTGDLVEVEELAGGRSIRGLQALSGIPLESDIDEIAQDPDQRGFLLSLAARLEGGVEATGEIEEPSGGVGVKVLPLPGPLRRLITRGLTKVFVKDVHDFFFVSERREVMRNSVRERIAAGGGPFVVIGHSQGSMIAYDVLSRLTHDEADVRLFLTIGSPLAITEVKDQLKILTNQQKLGIPSCVAQWVNVADKKDPVALDEELSNDYVPKGTIQDRKVENPDGPRHPHSGTGYLSTDPVRASVRLAVDTALFQPVAEFTIARDVTRQMEDHPAQKRHQVLIELTEPAGGDAGTIEERRERVVSEILRITDNVPQENLRIEQLKRFVAADLTRSEVERLATSLAGPAVGPGGATVRRIWKNSQKVGLLEVSGNTVQARPAHIGYGSTGRGIQWAVLDTGIVSHPHFDAHRNIATEYDCTRQGPLTTGGKAPDGYGHGTHVSGIIAGSLTLPAPTPRLFSGMAPEAKLHVYKVLDDRGRGQDAWIIKALDHIAEKNEKAGSLAIHGVNLSLGGPFDQSVYGCGHSPLCAELRRLWRQGVVVVLAAGNEGFAVLQTLEGTIDANMDLSIGDPANLEEAIAVGSIHKDRPHTYGISYFSSRGPTADGRQKPDLVAPGERVASCRNRFPVGSRVAEELYVEMSGTSMAAPHVSGVLAAYLSVRREFIGYPDRVKQILLSNCTDLARDRPMQGAGMPNLVRMLVST